VDPELYTAYNSGDFIRSAWFGADWQEAIDYSYTHGRPPVIVTGECIRTTPLRMRPGVRIINNGFSALLKQRNEANLGTLLDFATYAAHGAGADGVILDQNASQNAPNVSANLIQLWDTNDVQLKNLRLTNGTAMGIYGCRAQRPLIEDCWISDILSIPVYIDPRGSAPGASDWNSDLKIKGGRIFGNYGQHCLNIKNVRGVSIDGVKIQSMAQRGFNIFVNGHYVTAPGGFFAPNCEGKFLIFNGGEEFLIETYISPTQCYLSKPRNAGGPFPAVWGNGDTIGFENTTLSTVSNCQLDGGASLGISLFSNNGLSRGNTFVNNNISGLGSAGISLQQFGPQPILDTIISGNRVTDAGMNTLATNHDSNCGIIIMAGNVVQVNQNMVVGYSQTMPYGILFGGEVTGKSHQGNTVAGTQHGAIWNP
jgi:hypothetical protein